MIGTKNTEKLPGRNLLLNEGNVLARANYEQSEQDTPTLDMGAGQWTTSGSMIEEDKEESKESNPYLKSR